jgi:hypothetical protein
MKMKRPPHIINVNYSSQPDVFLLIRHTQCRALFLIPTAENRYSWFRQPVSASFSTKGLPEYAVNLLLYLALTCSYWQIEEK